MAKGIIEVYAKLDKPVEDDPTRSDRILYNGHIYPIYGMYAQGAVPPPGEGWKLVKAIKKSIEGRRAYIFEVIEHQK